MAKGPDEIEITTSGEVVIDDPELRFRLRGQSGRYRLLSDAAGVLILRKVLPGEEAAADPDRDELDDLFDAAISLETADIEGEVRVIIAGEVLTPMTLFQVIEVISNRNWNGDLRIFSNTGSVFELHIDQGALRYARSNEEQDLLGQTLIREGVLGRSQLLELLDAVSEERRLGDLLVEYGYVNQEELFDLLGKQIKSVFFRALLVPDGSYVFTTPDPKASPPAHTVHVPVRALLMEGIQRVDEMELFREVIPSPEVTFRLRTDRTAGLDAHALAVLPYCDEQHTLADIARATGLGEFVTTKAAYHLVKRKRVDVIPPTRVNPAVLERFMQGLEDIMRTIFETIEQHGDVETARSTLSAWVAGSGYSDYFGEELAPDGSLDQERLARAVQNARDDDPMATAHQIGHELVSFALFSAGSVLPREVEKELSSGVNQRLTQLRSR